MKLSEVGNSVLAGQVLLVGTYFSGRVDRISVRDKSPGANGARKDMLIAKEIIMTEREPITITAFLPDATQETERGWKPSAKKNDKVVVEVRTLEESYGNKSASGKIVPVTPETAGRL